MVIWFLDLRILSNSFTSFSAHKYEDLLKISPQYHPFFGVFLAVGASTNLCNKKSPTKQQKDHPKKGNQVESGSTSTTIQLISERKNRFKGDGDNLEFKKFSERRGGSEPDGKPRFRALDSLLNSKPGREETSYRHYYSNLNDYMIIHDYIWLHAWCWHDVSGVHFLWKIDIETIAIVELVNFCANFVTATSRKKKTTGLHCACVPVAPGWSRLILCNAAREGESLKHFLVSLVGEKNAWKEQIGFSK